MKKSKKPKEVIPKEAEIQKEIIKHLELLKEAVEQFDFFRMNLGGVIHSLKGGPVIRKKNPNEGMADLLVVLGGEAIWLEVKRPKLGKQSHAQKLFEERVIEAGSVYKIVTSLEETKDFLAHLIIGKENDEELPSAYGRENHQNL